MSAKASRTTLMAEANRETPIVLAAAVQETPTQPIKVTNINAMSGAEKEAVQQRFIAQRLASSTVIRTVKMTKSTLQSAATPEATADRLFVAGNVVNARAEPTTSSSVLAKLRRGTEVLPTNQSDGVGAQVIVSETGQSVWMHFKFLKSQS